MTMTDQERLLNSLKEFARWAITSSAFQGCDLDGGEVNDKAVELGILEQRDVSEPCGERCECAHVGFPTSCLGFSKGFSALEPPDA